MTPEEYHAEISYLSNSMMTKLLKSPAHLDYYIRNQDSDPPTPAQVLGTQVHTALLEPELFKDFVRGVDGDRRTKAVKEQHKELVEQYGADNIIKPATYDQIDGMVKSVMDNPHASSVIRSGQDHGKIEDSLFWVDSGTHIKCKARVDIVPHKSSLYGDSLIDFKSTIDGSKDAFTKSVVNFGYARQAVHYLRGWNQLNPDEERKNFIIIACEKSPPYAVAMYELSDDCLQFGAAEVNELYNLYAECESEDNWPSYPQTVQELDLPPWATPRIGQ
jgi:hypothetical protein